VLGLPCLGEVKLTIYLDKEKLTIDLGPARNLKQKTGYKFVPSKCALPDAASPSTLS